MTARLESIGRISEKGLDTVREKLLGKDDLSFLKSYFLKLTSKLLIFALKVFWDSQKCLIKKSKKSP